MSQKHSSSSGSRSSSSAAARVAARFLHDFTSDTSKPVLHDADQAAWWAYSLRSSDTANGGGGGGALVPATSGNDHHQHRRHHQNRARQGLAARSDNNKQQQQQQQMFHFGASKKQNSNNGGARASSASTSSSPPGRSLQLYDVASKAELDHRNNNTNNRLQQHQGSSPPTMMMMTNNNNNNNRTSSATPETRKRTLQLVAQARTGCATKFNPVLTSRCTGQRRWNPDTRVVPAGDPLYDLLHRRLEEEGFMDDFDDAQAKLREKMGRNVAAANSEEQQRKDRELRWYLEVYRPKQQMEALCEVESDARLEISEEEMAAMMRIRSRFQDQRRAIALRERQRDEKEDAELRAAARHRAAEARLQAEFLARGQHLIQEEEQRRRRELRIDHEKQLLSLFSSAQMEREHMCRVKLSLLNRLRGEFSSLFASEQQRRGSILALEATACKHAQQSFITDRSEILGKQRGEFNADVSRARRDTARAEADERAALLRDAALARWLVEGREYMLIEEDNERYGIEEAEEEEFSQLQLALAEHARAIEAESFMNKLAVLQEEFSDTRLEIMRDCERSFESAFREERRRRSAMVYDEMQELQAHEAAQRDVLESGYHNFVMYHARLEAEMVDLISQETAARFQVYHDESVDVREHVVQSLLASVQVREASERSAVLREEHQSTSRLIVEAAIVRDALVADRKDMVERQRLALMKQEHDTRNTFTSERLALMGKLVDDACARIAELQRGKDAKLLQQALRLTTNFVGIGLAERDDYLQVESLVVDGPGMVGGLRLGDMVLSVGGIPATTTLEMRSALKRSGFVSKTIAVEIRRFVPSSSSNAGGGGGGVERVELQAPPVVPTVRPEGTFLDHTETVQVLVSTTDERFKQFPFYFNPKKTLRVSLPLVA